MPIWNGKRKTDSKKRIMMCPKCHETNLRYGFLGGVLLGQSKLICPDCGYKGHVYVDINPTDTFEEDIEAEFLEENPDFMTSRKPTSQLAQMALDHKWLPDQKSNPHTLREWCPFCEDVAVICKICQCPPEICANHATKGLIGELNNQYENTTPLSEVDSALYQKIVKGFQLIVQQKSEQ